MISPLVGRWFGLVMCLCLNLRAQTGSPRFEAATIKTAERIPGERNTPSLRGGPGTADPTRLTFRNVSLLTVVGKAYDTLSFQVSGPSWLDSERFDISAAVAPGTTMEQFRTMLQNLLTDRFAMSVHHEYRATKGFVIVISKSGPKLYSLGADSGRHVTSAADSVMQPESLRGRSGTPSMTTAMIPSQTGITARLTATSQPISALATMLSAQYKMPITDRTGLTGLYTFSLEFSPALGVPAQEDALVGSGSLDRPEPLGPDIESALDHQLGLKLQRATVAIDVVVVDRCNRHPSDN